MLNYMQKVFKMDKNSWIFLVKYNSSFKFLGTCLTKWILDISFGGKGPSYQSSPSLVAMKAKNNQESEAMSVNFFRKSC